MNIRKVISEITEKIKGEYYPEKIILFGSYAYGNPDSNSDIDLLIIKKTKGNHIKRFVKILKKGEVLYAR